MLNQSIAGIAQQNGIPFEDMPRLLAEDGVDYAEFRRSLREEITIEQLRRIEVGQSINVSEREIEQCVADLEGNVVANSEYELSHILLTLPEAATADQVKRTRGAGQSNLRAAPGRRRFSRNGRPSLRRPNGT